MKKLVIPVLLIMAIFMACNKEDKLPQWVGVGTIEKEVATNDEFSIILDDGPVLHPNNVWANNNLEDEDRVIVYYAITQENTDDSYNVDLYNLENILTKDIIQLTEAIQDSIGNDPVHVDEDDIWITDHYLSFIFEYYAYFKSHYINLVKLYEDTHTEDGRLILEFRHNANNDFSSTLVNGIVSFDLESLRVADEDSVQFLVRVNDFDDEVLEWEGSYYFNNALQSTNNEAIFPKSTQLKISSRGLK